MLVLCKILGLLVNTLTDDDKYSLLYRDNLPQQIQILLSQKPKTFSRLSSEIFIPTLNFEHFQKKLTLIADVVRKSPCPKKVIK